VVDVCGTVGRFSYIQIIDVSFVPEEAPREASSLDDVFGGVTSLSVV